MARLLLLFFGFLATGFGEQEYSQLHVKQWLQDLLQAQIEAKATGSVEPLRNFIAPEYLEDYISDHESLREIIEQHQGAIKIYPIENTSELVSVKLLELGQEKGLILALAHWKHRFEADYISYYTLSPSRIEEERDHENIVSLRQDLSGNYTLECRWKLMVVPFFKLARMHMDRWRQNYREICEIPVEMTRKMEAVARPRMTDVMIQHLRQIREDANQDADISAGMDRIREAFLQKRRQDAEAAERARENQPQGGWVGVDDGVGQE